MGVLRLSLPRTGEQLGADPDLECAMQHAELTSAIIKAAMRVHSVLGPGFLETVYQRALTLELEIAGLQVEPKRRLTVHYDGVVVGHFIADVLVEDKVLLECKAVLSLVPAHEAQLVNYLTATGIDVGLLLNFGATSLDFRRKVRHLRRKTGLQD